MKRDFTYERKNAPLISSNWDSLTASHENAFTAWWFVYVSETSAARSPLTASCVLNSRCATFEMPSVMAMVSGSVTT